MRPLHLAAALILLVAAAALLAACGSGSPAAPQPAMPPATAAAATAPLVSESDPVLSTKPSPKADPVHEQAGPARGRPPQFGTDNDEASVSAGDPLDPCALVTRAEADAIVGALADRHRLPLGPSCTYTSRSRLAVTISVQSSSVSAAARHSRRTIRLTVHGRPAYCVNASQLAVLVPLSGGRVLTARGPCPLAARFAAAALPRIPA